MNLKKCMLLLALGTIGLQSCDNDDDNTPNYIPEALKSAFAEKYPDIRNEQWVTRGSYFVADFLLKNEEAEAWFTPEGIWQMTETDLKFAALPDPVRAAFEKSEFALWKVDDIDCLERAGMETVYVLEVEQGEKEMDLYYTAGGVLIKSVPDTDDDSSDYLPVALPEAIEQFLAERYPTARVAEVDVEDGLIEVDILHEGIGKEVIFGLDNRWLRSSWEVAVAILPAKVTEAIAQAPQYAGYHIDEADFCETPEGDFYELELEKGESEIKVKVSAEGQLIA